MLSAWSYVALAALVALGCGVGAWRLARDPARDPARAGLRRAVRRSTRDAAEAPRARARRGRRRQ